MKEWFEELDILCQNQHLYNDEEFNKQWRDINSRVPINIHYNHMKMNKIIDNRVKLYCDMKNIPLTEYDGCLPYKKYVIPVNNMTRKQAEKQISSLMKEYRNTETYWLPE